MFPFSLCSPDEVTKSNQKLIYCAIFTYIMTKVKLEITTIRLTKAVKKKMDKIRQHPRETYESIIMRLLKSEQKLREIYKK